MSKKILSMALAVVMLVSVFAFSVSAASDTTTFPVGEQAGYRVVSDAYVGMPAGSTVTVKIYYVLPADTDYTTYKLKANGANTMLAFTDGFSYVTNSRTWGATYDMMLSSATLNPNAYSTASKRFNEADKTMGWTQAIMVQTKFSTDSGLTGNDGIIVDPDAELYSVKFTTTKTLTAADSIGIPAGCAGTLVKLTKLGNSSAFTAANTIVTEATAYADVTKVSETADTKMRPADGATGKVDLGITGTVKTVSLDPGKTALYDALGSVAGYRANNITKVGAQARVNGVVSSAEDKFVYETTDGYQFRAAITGIDADGLAKNIEVRTYITDASGNTYYSNWMNIDATAVHTRAVGNGMTGIL